MEHKKIKPERFFEGVPDRTFEKVDVPPKPEPPKKKPMFKNIWNKVKTFVATHVDLRDIVANAAADFSITAKIIDEDSDGKFDALVSVYYKGKVVIMKTIKINP